MSNVENVKHGVNVINKPKRYVMLGMGYISGRHLRAIKDTGGELVAYHDIHDVVGHVDRYFMNAEYFPNFLDLDRFIDKCLDDRPVDYCVILLPNHLHAPACRWAMNYGMDVIVEKPIVLYEDDLDELTEVEKRNGVKINTILQMRLHDAAGKMKQDVIKPALVEITYHTPRGRWFKHGSWKADPEKSGGLTTAIGIHLFDLCTYLFGNWMSFEVQSESAGNIKGEAEYPGASVHWDLSVDSNREPMRVFRVNGVDYDFTRGFTDLHTDSYKRILSGKGFGIESARDATRLTEAIRNACRFPR